MDDLNQKLIKAMGETPQQSLPSEDNINPWQLLSRSFSNGTFRWVGPAVIVMATIAALLGIYCVVQMFDVEAVPNKIHWAVGSIFCFMTVLIIRLWIFMEMNRLSVLREIKRVELQLAVIASALQDK